MGLESEEASVISGQLIWVLEFLPGVEAFTTSEMAAHPRFP